LYLFGAATYRESHNFWGLGLTSELLNFTILAKKKTLSEEFSEAEHQR